MTFDRDAFLRKAIETPSNRDVTAIRDLLVTTLDNEGLDPQVDEKGNVLATRRTPDCDGPHLVLNTHIDTVPPHHAYQRDGDVVYGRGACDAKGPLAAFLDAFCTAAHTSGTLTLAITPDEETAQRGGAHLGDTLTADGYIVGEPTGLDVCIAARGNFGGRITIRGESAHASNPADGINAVRGVEPVLQALQTYDERRGPGSHDVLGDATLTPTHIEGGGPLNQVPDECTVSFDRRSVPPETIEGFITSLDSYLDQSLSEEYDVAVTAAYPDSPDPDAFATDSETDLVQTLAAESGGEIRPFEAATEASYFADDGPTVIFGPGALADEEGPVAHADREYISLSSVRKAADAVRRTVEQLC